MKLFVGKWLLLPFSGLYGLGTDIRNWLFNSHLLTAFRPSVYTISVGNLTVGGTGKTPIVELLIKRHLTRTPVTAGELATLSRGYGRQTKGFRIAADNDTAATIGDEPRQLYRKFTPLIRVCVGERRADAIRALTNQHPETKQILLDDAYQHRAVKPHLNLLLMDYTRPFYDDYPFPAGRLRERRNGARRADAIIVTKCPMDLFSTEQQRMVEKIRPYARPETPVYFAGLHYEQPVSFATRKPVSDLSSVVLVSGLANANPLEQYVRQTFRLSHHHSFADHHAYSRAELERIMATLLPNTALLTTEKDWVKLDAMLSPSERDSWPLYYLPVAVQFLPGHELRFMEFLNRSSLKNR